MVFNDFDELDDLYDRSSMDKVIDLRRVFGPRRPGRQARNPPPIGVGEITSSARRDTGALEVIARLRQPGYRGQPGGLAWYTPTGLVRYSVVAPDQSRILWQGNLGRIPALPAMSTAQREAAVRDLITQRTAQRFRNLPPGHRGPDLVPAFDAFTDLTWDGRYGRRGESWSADDRLDEFWPQARRYAAAARLALAVATGAEGHLSSAEKKLQDRTEQVRQAQDIEVQARNRRTRVAGAGR